jgi:quinol monooxygenase YgiN
MAFIQVIEVRTTKIEEIESLMDQWVSRTQGKRKTQRSVLTQDRERPNTYVQIVEFPSYEEAMTNSSMPETSEFAEKLVKLCDAPPSFRNLEVRRTDDLST